MAQSPTRSHGQRSIRASARPRSLLEEPPAPPGIWTARVLTLYPEMFPGTLGHSLLGRAREEGRWRLEVENIRSFGVGRHRSVDDTPAGGGPGMVLRADILDAALRAHAPPEDADWPLIILTPRGRPFTQARARRLAAGDGVTLVAGRFEGIDQRVIDAHAAEEVSIGDFVLTGGEIAAQALIDATVRLIPQVLGNPSSFVDESFSSGLLEHPHYTRPTDWDGRRIPEILLSGHHGQIAAWRHAQAEAVTKERRPDLWRAYKDPADGRELSDAHTIADKGETED
ncbi:MAG: tRNA (guanosine(37)-N1)-methyltransferase TrmD [Pseudomonadota bacterium]